VATPWVPDDLPRADGPDQFEIQNSNIVPLLADGPDQFEIQNSKNVPLLADGPDQFEIQKLNVVPLLADGSDQFETQNSNVVPLLVAVVAPELLERGGHPVDGGAHDPGHHHDRQDAVLLVVAMHPLVPGDSVPPYSYHEL